MIERITNKAKNLAFDAYSKLPTPQRDFFQQCFCRGFMAACDMLCLKPLDEVIEMLGEYYSDKQKEREEHLKVIDAYYLSQMPEEEYIRQLQENGEDIDEYMRIHHPEKYDNQCGDTK